MPKIVTFFAFLIFALMMGCASAPVNPAPTPVPNKPKPIVVNQDVELPLELVGLFEKIVDVRGKSGEKYNHAEGWFTELRILEKYPNQAPKKIRLTGPEEAVKEIVEFAAGNSEDTDAVTVPLSNVYCARSQ